MENERFHYILKQKLTILDLVRTGRLLRLYTQFPKVTQKQIEEWTDKEEEIEAMPEDKRAIKYTLHKGPAIKYRELYQFLYQTVKTMRSEREPVTVDSLIQITQKESKEAAELTYKGCESLIRISKRRICPETTFT